MTTVKGIRGLADAIRANRLGDPASGGTLVNASAYRLADVIRDVLQPPYAAGGRPDVILASSRFLFGLATWGGLPERIPGGVVIFGVPVAAIAYVYLGGLAIVEVRSLEGCTAISLTSSDLTATWRGPADRAMLPYLDDRDVDLEIGVGDEARHAYVSGIIAFSSN